MASKSERWQQIEELLHAVLECETSQRAALLEGVAPDVRREVESLLADNLKGHGAIRGCRGIDVMHGFAPAKRGAHGLEIIAKDDLK